MKTIVNINICPSCGSNNIKRVKKEWINKFQGKTYTVPSLEFYECPNCGERIYDRQAMRKIEAHSPAFVKKGRSKKTSPKHSPNKSSKEDPVIVS